MGERRGRVRKGERGKVRRAAESRGQRGREVGEKESGRERMQGGIEGRQ